MRIKSIAQQINVNLIPDQYGLYQYLVNQDEELSQVSCAVTVINDLDVQSTQGKEHLKNLLLTSYDTDTLPILPTCDCGNPQLTGAHHVGKLCPECNTVVVPATERPIESNVWFRAPEGVRALINPAFWMTASKIFTVSRVNILEWLVNPTYRTNDDNIYPIEVLKASKHSRGLNYFVEHFDELMELLLNGKTIQSLGPQTRENVKLYIHQNRKAIFSQYLPIPNKIAFIMESSPTGTYSDTKMASAIDAVRSIESIYTPSLPVSQAKKENRTVKAIKQLGEYYTQQFKEGLGTKGGWCRKHAVGSRQDFSARCVISSITQPHHYEEVHLPLGVSVGLFHIHIANRLLRRGLEPNEIERRIHYATTHLDDEIYQILCDLIAEWPGGGPRIIVQRNPTLSAKSAQLLRVTRVKSDPKDITMGVSVLCLNAWNADFDGDALNIKLILDNYLTQELHGMRPHLGVLDVGGARKISSNISIPAPILATAANWLYSDY